MEVILSYSKETICISFNVNFAKCNYIKLYAKKPLTLTQNNSRIVISDYIRKMAAAKVSTNLTRLAVAKNPHHLLGVFYSKSLRALAKMPSDYAYRKHTEQIILERAEMVKTIKVIIKIFDEMISKEYF